MVPTCSCVIVVPQSASSGVYRPRLGAERVHARPTRYRVRVRVRAGDPNRPNRRSPVTRPGIRGVARRTLSAVRARCHGRARSRALCLCALLGRAPRGYAPVKRPRVRPAPRAPRHRALAVRAVRPAILAGAAQQAVLLRCVPPGTVTDATNVTCDPPYCVKTLPRTGHRLVEFPPPFREILAPQQNRPLPRIHCLNSFASRPPPLAAADLMVRAGCAGHLHTEPRKRGSNAWA
jgi:hypothetical protein